MIFVGTGLEVVVFQSSALILGGSAAGDDLDLVDGLHGHQIEDGAIVALLADGGERNSIEILFTESLCSTADDRGAATRVQLRAWQQV